MSAAFGVTMSARDPQHVDIPAVPSEEAAIVEAVRVHSTVEPFREAQREFHAVFVTHLGD